MSNYAILAEGLSKQYVVGSRQPSPTLRDALTKGMAAGLQALWDRQIHPSVKETFWALKNVSFQVKSGEIVGIIGRNGAGKSTLLKILSRITMPSEGRAVVRGRVASLLEIGTGFHPELTGRENIFLNGAILGMTHREICRKFDEIVSFAEVERFTDTPVKRYSSGMHMRLAFAVAAHLEPEILIVDEVLAVGDAKFQKKCLEKMHEVSRQEGRTILLVTHNMEMMLKSCNRAILLHAGKIVNDGDPKLIAPIYFENQLSNTSRVVDLRSVQRGGRYPGTVRFVQAAPCKEKANWSFPFGEEVALDLTIHAQMPLDNIDVAIGLYSMRGFEVASWTSACAGTQISLSPGRNTFQIIFENMLLLPGQYYLGLDIRSKERSEDYIPNAFPFEVVKSDKFAEINGHLGGAFVPSATISKVE